MDDCIVIKHNLLGFSVTKEPRKDIGSDGKPIYITEGISTLAMPEYCPVCGEKLHNHGTVTNQIEDLEILGVMSRLEVTRQRKRCPKCHHTEIQELSFASENHRVSKRLEKKVIVRSNNGDTITSISKAFSLHPNTVFQIDYDNLKEKFKERKPEYARFIGIDEFKLHDGHKYATVVINLVSGEVIFLEEGKKKEQAINFFKAMGKEWMRRVKAVSMDMNAQYDSAFKEYYPEIDIVYDHFHLIKLYNDSVISKVRRRLQNYYEAKSDDLGYSLLKNTRYLVVSKMSTLEKKDKKAKENNQYLHDYFIMNRKSLPAGERMMRSNSVERLEEVFKNNQELQVVYFLGEQLSAAYEEDDVEKMRSGLNIWCEFARRCIDKVAGIKAKEEEREFCIPKLEYFIQTVEKRIEGIINHAKYKISNGIVEGTNNMIKTLRRKAYGFKNTEYFFLKIKMNSLKKIKPYKSNRITHFQLNFV